MNHKAMLVTALLATVLAGCGSPATNAPADGGTDESERRLITDLNVRACVEQLTVTIGNADQDKERLCTCATERLAQGKSLDEITRMPAESGYEQRREQALASCRTG